MRLILVGGSAAGGRLFGEIVAPLGGGREGERGGVAGCRRRTSSSVRTSSPPLPGARRPLSSCVPPPLVSAGRRSLPAGDTDTHIRPSQHARGRTDRHRLTHTPKPALPVRSLSRAAAVANVISIDGDELLTALRRLLLLPELVVLPASLVLPQLPVSAFRPERKTPGGQSSD